MAYEFHDYKVSGIDRARLERWTKAVGWATLLNRAGTTFRKLPDAAKANLTAAKAVQLMLEQPAMIKRPVLERGRLLQVGLRCIGIGSPVASQAPREGRRLPGK